MGRREEIESAEKRREETGTGEREEGDRQREGAITLPFDYAHLLKTDVLLWGHYFLSSCLASKANNHR